MGNNTSNNFSATQHDVSLEGKLEPGSEVVLTASGNNELFGDTIVWDLNVRATLQATQG